MSDINKLINDISSNLGVSVIPTSDGEFYRYGKKKEIYVMLSIDANFAVYGNWKTGEKYNWFARDSKTLSKKQRAEYNNQWQAEKQKIKREQQKRYLGASNEAHALYQQYSNDCSKSKYLEKKQVDAYLGVKYDANYARLVLPITDIDGNLQSLQYIYDDGAKRFFKGGKVSSGCFILGDINTALNIYLCEGYATGATIKSILGADIVVVIGFSVSNLLTLAGSIKSRYPFKQIINCADNDVNKERNAGKELADKLYEKYGIVSVFPNDNIEVI